MIDLTFLATKSVTHILDQGKPSVNHDGECMYRGIDGLSCAAAPFIVKYDAAMELKSFKDLACNWEGHVDSIAVENYKFVGTLQYAHDTAVECTESDSEFLRKYVENIFGENEIMEALPPILIERLQQLKVDTA